ncbi:MAG: hypothetical protein ACPL6C_03725, partial [bacterium]
MVTSSPPNQTLSIIDDFNDGDYTNNPTWTVQYGSWSVVGGALQNAGTASYDYITTPFSQAYGIWQFRFKHSITGSSISNKLRFYVVMDQTDYFTHNGYYMIINSGGGTVFGQPYAGLVRMDNGAGTFIINTDGNPVAWPSADTNWHTARIERTNTGAWSIFIDGIQYGPTVVDNNYTTSNFIGLRNDANGVYYVTHDDIGWSSLGGVTPPSVTVTSPNGGENWVAQSTQSITWIATPGTYPLKTNPITIYYSTTGSGGPWKLIAANEQNDGSYTWTLPATTSNNAYIRVTAEDNAWPSNMGSDISDNAFRIIAATPPSVTLTSPNGGEVWVQGTLQTITWKPATPGTFPLKSNP